MADETTTENAGAETATEALTATPAIKKTRAARRPKTAEVAPVEATPVPAKKTRATRGSKLAAAKAGMSIADLITLEQENKQLRKQLSEKLRAENADLRKRLGQN